jgi:hypothetical protein
MVYVWIPLSVALLLVSVLIFSFVQVVVGLDTFDTHNLTTNLLDDLDEPKRIEAVKDHPKPNERGIKYGGSSPDTHRSLFMVIMSLTNTGQNDRK